MREPHLQPWGNRLHSSNQRCAFNHGTGIEWRRTSNSVDNGAEAPISWTRFSDGLIVAIGTVTAYFVALTHQSGYNTALGIPENLIDVSP